MTVSINGTSGIVNDATDLNYTGTLTGGTGVVNLGSGQVYKDASGNVGIGVVPSAWDGTFRALQNKSATLASSGSDVYLFANAYYNGGYKYITTGSGASRFYQDTDGSFNWQNAPSGTAGAAITFASRMTLDSSGNLQVGGATTSVTRLQVLADAVNAAVCTQVPSTSSFGHILFRNPNGLVGQINTSGTSTAYNTSSDYRLKEDIAPMTGALAKVAALKPCTYKWKVDGSDGQGFIAHELAEVEAGCVTGEKDAVDADGNPKYQGIDTSFLVATLAAAIQEQQTLITALTARITALETAA